MGYCPFEHWLGWAQGAGRTARHGRRGVGRAGAWAWQQRAGRALQASWGARGARPSVLLGQLVVHSVHAACFLPGLTRYFSGVRFLDIVREPGS